MQKKGIPLASASHPLLPIVINVYNGPKDPPCPLLDEQFKGHFRYEADGEHQEVAFPESDRIRKVDSVDDVIAQMTSELTYARKFFIKSSGWGDLPCAIWVLRSEVEEWDRKANHSFEYWHDAIQSWINGDDRYFTVQLDVRGKKTEHLVWADNALIAARVSQKLIDDQVERFWDFIPDKFTWSARLKRAMKDLARHCEDLVGVDGLLRYAGYSLDDLPPVSYPFVFDYRDDWDLGSKFVLAKFIAEAVSDFDWALADEKTLQRRRWWLTMEPSQEMEAPTLPLPTPGEDEWNSYYFDAWPGFWRMAWQGEWVGNETQKVFFSIDRSGYLEGGGIAVQSRTLGEIRDALAHSIPFPWVTAQALSYAEGVLETFFDYNGIPVPGFLEAVYPDIPNARLESEMKAEADAVPEALWDVRVYRPYIVDYQWKLQIPAKSMEEALELAVKGQTEPGIHYKPQWVTERGFMEDGTGMPSLHGKTTWEVADMDASDKFMRLPDTSKQRSFVWAASKRSRSFAVALSGDHIAKDPRNDIRGVLIAEEVGEGSLAGKHFVRWDCLANGYADGLLFRHYDKVYSILWSFRDPQ